MGTGPLEHPGLCPVLMRGWASQSLDGGSAVSTSEFPLEMGSLHLCPVSGGQGSVPCPANPHEGQPSEDRLESRVEKGTVPGPETLFTFPSQGSIKGRCLEQTLSKW